MKPTRCYVNGAIAPMLAAILLNTGCEFAPPPGLRDQAVLLYAQPWGLFAVVEVTLLTMLAMAALTGLLFRLLRFLVYARPVQSLLRMHITKRRTASGCVVLQVHDEAWDGSWWLLDRQLAATPADALGVIVDLSLATAVQTSFLVRLCQTQKEWASARKSLEIIGLAP